MQIANLEHKPLGGVMVHRLIIIATGIVVQVVIIAFLLTSLRSPAPRNTTFASVAGNPTACRVTGYALFTDAWIKNIPPGSLVRSATNPSQALDCATLTGSLYVIARPYSIGPLVRDNTLNVSSTFPPVDFTTVALITLLTLIFNVAGITVFLRSQNRPIAHVTYGLFYSSALLFSIIIAYGYDYLWVNLLTLFLSMIIRGLSTTFVCLFPRPLARKGPQRVRLLPYIPFGVGLLIILASPFLLMLPQAQSHTLFLLAFIYNVACLIVVAWVLFWGLRRVASNELQLTRMIVVAVVFLLTPLAFALNIIQFDNLTQVSLTRLIVIPLLILPIACDYALFRHELLGTTSLISRRTIRVLLWLLLASLFIFPAIILLHSLRSVSTLPGETRDYIFAGIFVIGLWLFPLAWGKVRDIGDQVLYHDFYQYNRSLRELSSALTRLQGLDQICTFILPRLTTLLNASDVALLVRANRSEEFPQFTTDHSREMILPWHVYRQPLMNASLAKERLIGVAQLALTHSKHSIYEPLLLDNILLLGLYDGTVLNGFLCLGPKKNVEPYNRQDISFLETLIAQLAVLVVNDRYLSQAKADAQKLSALNHRVVSAQEDERKHLALELHDESLQQAMLLVRQLSDAGTMSDVAEAMPLARSLVTSLRHTCLELRPPLLDELGLVEALQWLAQDIGKRGKVRITVECKGIRDQRLSPAIELALYRVAQEALANVVKHANAHKVSMRLYERSSGECSLLICDDGRGFQRQSTQAEHLGLASMLERMEAIGGHMHIRSSLGQGVAIRATYVSDDRRSTMLEERQALLR